MMAWHALEEASSRSLATQLDALEIANGAHGANGVLVLSLAAVAVLSATETSPFTRRMTVRIVCETSSRMQTATTTLVHHLAFGMSGLLGLVALSPAVVERSFQVVGSSKKQLQAEHPVKATLPERKFATLKTVLSTVCWLTGVIGSPAPCPAAQEINCEPESRCVSVLVENLVTNL